MQVRNSYCCPVFNVVFMGVLPLVCNQVARLESTLALLAGRSGCIFGVWTCALRGMAEGPLPALN